MGSGKEREREERQRVRHVEILPPKPKFQILSVRLKGKLKAEGLLFLFHLIGQEDKASYNFLHIPSEIKILQEM